MTKQEQLKEMATVICPYYNRLNSICSIDKVNGCDLECQYADDEIQDLLMERDYLADCVEDLEEKFVELAGYAKNLEVKIKEN